MKVFQKIKSAFARGAIRVYFKGKRITFKDESNGTVRYNVAGLDGQGFYRVRLCDVRRLELTHGETFSVFHYKKFTFGFEAGHRSAGNFATNAK